MSRSGGRPGLAGDGALTGAGYDEGALRGLASAHPARRGAWPPRARPRLRAAAAGAWRSRRRSSGRCHSPWRPGRLAAAGGVEADRPRAAATAGRRWWWSRPPPGAASAAALERLLGGAARGARPAQVGEHHRADSPGTLAARDGHARAGAPQASRPAPRRRRAGPRWSRAARAARRPCRRPSPRRPRSTRRCSGCIALKPGVRCRAMRRTGEVGST